jgi:hypothetical protein
MSLLHDSGAMLFSWFKRQSVAANKTVIAIYADLRSDTPKTNARIVSTDHNPASPIVDKDMTAANTAL